eukprot:scaffold1247_cov251-Pinguiococcus_pyrenoidosus.AAC.22
MEHVNAEPTPRSPAQQEKPPTTAQEDPVHTTKMAAFRRSLRSIVILGCASPPTFALGYQR